MDVSNIGLLFAGMFLSPFLKSGVKEACFGQVECLFGLWMPSL